MDFSAAPTNDPQLVQRYQELLQDCTQDWRELWLPHGPESDGLPQYRNLIAHHPRILHPDLRARITASNGIGVDPVIVRRSLREALAP